MITMATREAIRSTPYQRDLGLMSSSWTAFESSCATRRRFRSGNRAAIRACNRSTVTLTGKASSRWYGRFGVTRSAYRRVLGRPNPRFGTPGGFKPRSRGLWSDCGTEMRIVAH